MKRFIRFLLFVCIFTTLPLRSAVLVDDPFTDGSRNNLTGGDPLGSVWYLGTNVSNAVTVVDDTAGIGDGLAFKLAPPGNFYKALTFFPRTGPLVRLNYPGDSISVTFDYRFPVAPSALDDGFRVGLGYSGGTRQNRDEQEGTRSDDINFGFNTNPGQASINGTKIAAETAEGLNGDILGGANRKSFGISGQAIASGTATHKARLSIARTSTGALFITAQIDGLSAAAYTYPAASVTHDYYFDEFALGFGAPATGELYNPIVLIDNVRIETQTLPIINITATVPSVREGSPDQDVFTVTRSSSSGDLNLPYTIGGTARSEGDFHEPVYNKLGDLDFVPLAGLIYFPAGISTVTLPLTAKTDHYIESDETVIITLTPGSDYLLQTGSAQVTIQDDPTQNLISDADFFAALDLNRPELSEVRACVLTNDYSGAISALAQHYRTRTTPVFTFPHRATAARADNALQNIYSIAGYTYTLNVQLTPVFSLPWSANPTVPRNDEWVWQLGRHAWWDDFVALGINHAGAITNASYLARFRNELNDWLSTSPIPATGYNIGQTTRWRALDAAQRMRFAWPYSFFRAKGLSSADFSNELLVRWVKGFYMHGLHLYANRSSISPMNIGTNQAQGLYNVGALFPEFESALKWRTAALGQADAALNNGLTADGVDNEFAPSYHDLVITNLEEIKTIATDNSLLTSSNFKDKLEQLYDYLLYAMEPNRSLPRINDSTNEIDVPSRMQNAYAAFNQRSDYQWVATDGRDGTPPAVTSTIFQDAGQVVMRSGWSTDDNYLLMDAGPYGTAHQHEDKLSINVDGYGIRHIIDAGPYSYDVSDYRKASLSSFANSQPIIDDLSQNRDANQPLGSSAIPASWTEGTPIKWHTSKTFDYTAADYGTIPSETWGPDKKQPAITTRHIFFMKPNVWVIIDAFKALDGLPHKYSALFNCSDQDSELDPVTKRTTIQLKIGETDPYDQGTRVMTTVQPSLTITPCLDGNVSATKYIGQTVPPFLGWQYYTNSPTQKRAIPTLRYDRTVIGDTQMAYVLAAAPATATPRTPQVTSVLTASGTYGVQVTFGQPGDTQIFLVGLNGTTTTWQNVTYSCPALIVWNGIIFQANGDTLAPTVQAPSTSFSPQRLRTPGPTAKVALPDYTGQAITSDNLGVVRVSQVPAAGTPLGSGVTEVTLTAWDAAGNRTDRVVSVGVNVVAYDSFSDGERSNTARGDGLGLDWFQSVVTPTGSPSAVSIVDGTTLLGDGPALQLAPATPTTPVDFYKVLAFFSKQTLANTGDSISLTFDYRFPLAPVNQGDGLRVGLGNSAGTQQTADGNGPSRFDDINYGFNTNPGQTSNTGTTIKYEDLGNDILGGARPSLGTSGGSIASDTDKHRAVFTITLQANRDLLLTAKIDNLVTATATHAAASVLTYSFDELALGFGGTGYRPTLLVDNVTVTAKLFDTTPPVLTLNGTTPLTISAESIYNDAGATAIDNLDGEVQPVKTGVVNTQQLGLHIITYKATDAAGNTSTKTRSVNVASTPLFSWRSAQFGTQSTDISVAGDLADPNRNGLPNLLEYALGGNPLSATGISAQPILAKDDVTKKWSIKFNRYTTRTDATITLMGADSLQRTDSVRVQWVPMAESVGGASFVSLMPEVAPAVTIVETGTGVVRTVTIYGDYPTTEPAYPQRFLRLRVTR